MKYVRCDSHCKYPAYDKEEINSIVASIGESLDLMATKRSVYVKDDYAVLTGQVVMKSGTGSTTVNYPESFTQDNCVVLSFGQSREGGTAGINFGYGIRSTDYLKGSLTRNVALTSSNIEISVANGTSEGNGDQTYNYKIVLMKIA